MPKPFQTDIQSDKWRNQKPHENPLLDRQTNKGLGQNTNFANGPFPGNSTGTGHGEGNAKGNYVAPSAEGGQTQGVPGNTMRSSHTLGEDVKGPVACRYNDRTTTRRGEAHGGRVHHSDRTYTEDREI